MSSDGPSSQAGRGSEPGRGPARRVGLWSNLLGAARGLRTLHEGHERVVPASPSRGERAAAYLAPVGWFGIALLLLGKSLAAVLASLAWLRLPGQLFFEVMMGLMGFAVVGQFLPGVLARRSLERARRAGYRLCTRCHYALDGLGDECDCPECGERFALEKAKAAWEARVPRMVLPKPTYRE